MHPDIYCSFDLWIPVDDIHYSGIREAIPRIAELIVGAVFTILILAFI